ncbi:MAG: TolC family protein [Verrucomicrobiota bacterium]
MRRSLFLALVTFTLGLTASAEVTLSREEVLRLALNQNPNVKAARARWSMMKERVPQARAWEDLMAGVDFQRMGTTSLTNVNDAEWMISQVVPVSGKNRSRERAAAAEALGAYQELRRAQLDVANRAQTAYIRLAGAYGQLEINRRNQELLKQFTNISRGKYEVGTATQSDVLLSETEEGRLSESKAMFERDVSDQQSQLNVLLNRPAKSPLARPEPLTFQPPTLGADKAEALAAAHRPEVLLASRKVEAEKARLELAHRQWIPDPQLRVAARQFSPTSGIREYDTGIFFSVPWANRTKYKAAVAEAADSLENAVYLTAAARIEASGLVRDQLKKIETFATNYRLFHERIARTASMAVESTRAGYETDKNSFLELITAQRNLQDVESAALNQLIEHQVAVAELESVVGASRFVSEGKETVSK